LPNTLAELQRDMARLGVVTAQIKEIEATRLERLDEAPEQGTHAGSSVGARRLHRHRHRDRGHEILSRHLRDRRAVAGYAYLTGARTQVASGVGRRVSPRRATLAFAAA
jgi:transposase